MGTKKEEEKKARTKERGREKTISGHLEVVKIVKVNPGPVINQLYLRMMRMMDRSYIKELLSSNTFHWLGKLMMVCAGWETQVSNIAFFPAYPFLPRLGGGGAGAGG